MDSSQRKSQKLGMPFGTASARLRKAMLFYLAGKVGALTCFRCEQQIVSIDDFSMEHKDSWECAAEPLKAFLDVQNIAFSHLSCNCSAASRPNKRYDSKQERWATNSKIWHARQRARQHGPVAQLEEQARPKRKVAGSSPARITSSAPAEDSAERCDVRSSDAGAVPANSTICSARLRSESWSESWSAHGVEIGSMLI
jgi:hypothetical protein